MSASCAICMASYGADENTEVVMVKCGHVFHRGCLMEWKNSSQQMTCPECRTKFTVRTLRKIYLNVLDKDDEVNSDLHNQLQQQSQKVQGLQVETQKLEFDVQCVKVQLMQKNGQLQEYVTCFNSSQANLKEKNEQYDLMKLHYDSQLSLNNKLKTENEEMKKQNENLKRELIYFRVQQIRKEKPFVDLTTDNEDSDVEIVASEIPTKKRKLSSPKPTDEVIELNDDETPEDIKNVLAEVASNTEKPLSIPFEPKPENNLLYNPFAKIHEDPFQEMDTSLESFNFILDQIPKY